MRKFVRNVAAAAATLALSVAAVAQTAPTPPTSAVGLAQAIDMSDAKSAGLIIIGLLAGVGVVLWGARLVLSKFAPRI